MDFETTIKMIMSKDLTTVFENDTVESFKDHFKRRAIHHILVEDEKHNLKGIISTEDINRTYRFMSLSAKITAAQIMTKNPICLKENMPIVEAVHLFLEHRFRALPVLNEQDELTGIVTSYDLMKEMLNAFYLEKEMEDEEDFV